ncbi:glycosyltransferase [Paludibaculum fermentans]|uniref:Glycosyltransferase n=1 Tax=Paludibaculum fermentans TaxID=1473598 RepID=A0A7S7SNE4_PALFE|nr:glycosyltransferase [Paludibaculum fermentans]
MQAVIRLSVVVAVVGDQQTLSRCLEALVPQTLGKPVEVILPFDDSMQGMDRFQARFPEIQFLDLGHAFTQSKPGTVTARHELFDRRASQGLKAARGEVIALVQDWGAPAPDWCDQVLEAHRLPHAAIGGAVENRHHNVFNWAVFLLDFGRYQLPLPEGPANYLTDVNTGYKRAALEEVRHLWTDRYNEVTVNWELLRRGHTLWQTPRILVYQDRGPIDVQAMMSERFAWGRIFGAARAHWVSSWMRWVYILAVPLITPLLVLRPGIRAVRTGRGFFTWLRCMPAMLLFATPWCLGEAWGLLTRQSHPHEHEPPQ